MIAYLEGKIIAKTGTYFILQTGGVGYQIFVGDNFLATITVGNIQNTYIHHRVREDVSDLYGFSSLGDLELFELLLSVSGVGPKSALAVLSLAATNDIKEAIIRGDAGLLMKVSGIGKKTAERIVLELKNKVLKAFSGDNLGGEESFSGLGEELDALLALGYSVSESRSALNKVGPELTSTASRVKAALRYLGR